MSREILMSARAARTVWMRDALVVSGEGAEEGVLGTDLRGALA